MPTRLFALFIGIDTYQRSDAIRTLHGAEADARKMESYIRAVSQGIDFQPELLLGSQATRGRVVDGIRSHLSQASGDDVVLFYFSGHGIREKAPQAFQHSIASSGFDSLVCYDSYASASEFGLANKEIRYLLHEIAGNRRPHLAVLTDCCHSGAATRGGIEPVIKRQVENKENMAPERCWEHFLFADKLSSKEILSFEDLDIRLPQAPHLHLAACQSAQSAFEVGGEGVFTGHLLEVLQQSNGAVSYQQLRERTAGLIRARTRQYDQTPNIYETGDGGLGFKPFLGLQVQKNKIAVTVTLGEERVVINKGLIHGIPPASDQDGIDVSIFERDDPQGREVCSAKIWETGISDATLSLLGEHSLQQDRLYEAEIQGLYGRDFMVALWSDDADEGVRNRIDSRFKEVFQKPLQEKPDVRTDCVVVLHQNQITLAHPDSDYASFEQQKYLPLVEQLEGYSDIKLNSLMGYLQHISKYEFTRNIFNPNTNFRPVDFELGISISPEQPGKEVKWNRMEQCFDIHLGNPGDQKAGLNLEVLNQSGEELYFSLMYMSQLYGVFPNFFDQSGMSIPISHKKSQSVTKKFRIERFIEHFNMPWERGLFRLFAATKPFNLQGFELSDLPEPTINQQGKSTRGVLMGLESKKFQAADWVVVDYPIRILNSAFNDNIK